MKPVDQLPQLPANCVRFYEDGPDWPVTAELQAAEAAYRQAFYASVTEAIELPFRKLGTALEAAWRERRRARREAEVRISSAKYFSTPGISGKQVVYRTGHSLPASRTRGRVQALEILKTDWLLLRQLGVVNDQQVCEVFLRPWAAAVKTWSVDKLNAPRPPARPCDCFSLPQWEFLISKQRRRLGIFGTFESVQQFLQKCFGTLGSPWDCRNEEGEILGAIIEWMHAHTEISCLVARQDGQWVVYENFVTRTHYPLIRVVSNVTR